MANENIPLLQQYEKEYSEDPEFIAQGLALKVTEEMLQCLDEKGVSQTELADQMEVSRAHISHILRAKPNMTLLTIAKIAVALKVKPDVCLDTEPWRIPSGLSLTVNNGATLSSENVAANAADIEPNLEAITA